MNGEVGLSAEIDRREPVRAVKPFQFYLSGLHQGDSGA